MGKRAYKIVQGVGVISATAAIMVGATFAALTSTATLTGNTLSSVTGNLQVNNTENGGSPTSSDTGYAFSDIVPGADYGTSHTFTLFNNGTATLGVTVSSTSGTATGIDKTKVHVKFVDTDESNVSADYTLAQLESAQREMPGVSGAGSLSPTEEDHFTVQVKLDGDAVTGTSGSVGSFDLVFTGTAI
jgi:hypothetical protein